MGDKPKAAILYLCSSLPKYVTDLKLSLSYLDKNFNDQFKYPVIVFHRDFSEELMEDIRKSTRSHIIFDKIKFEIPDFLNKDDIPEYYLGYDIEYRHMCRFLGGPIYWQPALKNYDWYWRLDTDSFLLDKIDYDIFLFMKKNNYKYGYVAMLRDRPKVVEGLWDFVKKYIKENKIQPTFLRRFMRNGVWDRTIYYTNFEIGSLDFWCSEKFRKYFDYLDRSGGIYKYRWGDTAFRSLAVYMFMPEKQFYQFKNIGYRHQSFVQSSKFNLSIFLKKQAFYFMHRWYWLEPVLGKFIKYPRCLKSKIKNFIKHTPLYTPICHILELKEMQNWEKKGRCGPSPHLIKQKIVKEYAHRFAIDTLVETGTYEGRMVSAAKNTLKEIFSIELEEKLFERAKKKFANYPHIHIIHGDSGKILPEILASLKKPCLFWLDAHYSGGITTKGDVETPIKDELEAIFQHSVQNHVILIDDARYFIGKNDYPTIKWLKDYIFKYHPDWNFEIKYNIIRVYPSK